MTKLVILGGAPGSGKSTLAALLKIKLNVPDVDFGKIRRLHLDETWNGMSDEEEAMSFESLLFIINNYFEHGYSTVVAHDLRGRYIEKLTKEFPGAKVITLLPRNTDLEKRIRARKRNDRSAYGKVEEAIKYNDDFRNKPLLPNETRIEIADLSPEQILEEVIKVL